MWPQVPQLKMSSCVSTQAPLQHVKPMVHAGEQVPPLLELATAVEAVELEATIEGMQHARQLDG